ncbi:lytic transglycosylase domain-containing protein [Intrasporangium sp. YIM S08009]|uniref:lytic transglycosylase domain-containing protein n=1 Tax=Intrasporangium zincisolvens TaxID=3080018 RepID=UPI002B053028|nr:lytic transglycosylase domain-containing protein [Intrasporangium sp. YIM S08009]
MVRIVRAGRVSRRVAAALPVIALAATGIAVAARSGADPTPTALTVPDQAVTQSAGPDYPDAGPAPAPMQLPPVYDTYTSDYASVAVPSAAQEAVHALAGFMPVRLDANGIPSLALSAYQHAAGLLDGVDPSCGVDWALLGAIGRVESNHAQFGGNRLDASGVARPGIIGIPLDGSRGTSRITDTDGGRLDRDSVYDRAVGPMQFIPTSWSSMGRDGNGDGVSDPQNLTDAVTAAGAMLCSGHANLRDPKAAYDAVFRYNHSDSYVRSVLSIADAYRRGVSVVPVGSLPAARPAAGTGTATPDGSGFAYAGPSAHQPTASSGARPTPGSSAKPSPSPSKPAPKPSGSGSGTPAPKPAPSKAPRPAITVPVPKVPGVPLPTPTVPVPVLPSVPVPVPTLPAEIVRLLALPHLPLLPGDPTGLVRVLDPLTTKVVCLLDKKVVTCPVGGLLG